MKSISALKEDMDFSRDLGSIIEAFKAAALIQFRLFQTKDKLNGAFLKGVLESFKLLPEDVKSIYFSRRANLPKALVVVTSDEGFLGELNTLLINTILDERDSKEDEIIVLGERGARYLEDVNEEFVFFPGVTDKITYKEAEGLYRYLLGGFNKKIGQIIVIYPEFISLGVQKVKVFNMLPLLPPLIELRRLRAKESRERVLLEPSEESAVQGLVELWMVFKFLEIFRSSKQSEYAARVMHLEGSTNELSHLNKNLRLDYFRQLHALSDKSIREISASKLLLKEDE